MYKHILAQRTLRPDPGLMQLSRHSDHQRLLTDWCAMDESSMEMGEKPLSMYRQFLWLTQI